MGPPGSGKGTQAQWLSTHYNLEHIATGDMLRAEIKSGSPLGQEVEGIVRSGKLVGDTIIERVLRARFKKIPSDRGYILDGVPRTMAQAEAVNRANQEMDFNLDAVLQLSLADEIIVRRLVGRRVHLPSGRTYHVEFAPPVNAGCDDITGEPLTQRADDNEQTIMERLKVYHRDTEPLLDYYKKLGLLHAIPGEHSVDEVRASLNACLQQTSSLT